MDFLSSPNIGTTTTDGVPAAIPAARAPEVGVREQVLFVVDDAPLLAGLSRMLRHVEDRWSTSFVSTGAEALELLDRQPVDAIVVDLWTPEMDGAQLLAEVQRRHPGTVRIVLSGQAGHSTTVAATRSAHQFLSTSSDLDTLTDAVDRALRVRRTLDSPVLREILGGAESLPVLPAVYHELVEAMDSPDADLATVGSLLASDVGISAEVLRLANSAFFGLPREVPTVELATALLGLDTIQALVLTGAMFRTDPEIGRLVDVDDLRSLALYRAGIARAVGRSEQWAKHEIDLTVLACMLRDVGVLVLARGMPEAAAEMRAAVDEDRRNSQTADPLFRAELEAESFGCTIPQASAYLLGLWGFAPAVIHAVAAQPARDPGPGMTSIERLLAFAHHRALDPMTPVPDQEVDYLTTDRVEVWNAICDEILIR